MKRRWIIVILQAMMLIALAVYNGCEFVTPTRDTITGNPKNPTSDQPSMKILNAACGMLIQSHPGLTSDQCQSGVLSTSFSSALGVPQQTLNPYWNLANAERAGAVKADSTSLQTCLADISALNPTAPQVQSAFNPTAFNPFSGVANMIPTAAGSCPQVYVNNGFPSPTPSPTPQPGITVVDFDHPAPPGVSLNALSGLFQGIDFSDALWQWEEPFGADTSNHIFISPTGASSASFSFSGGPKILQSLNLFSAQQGGIATISDDTGQSMTQFIPADLSMHLVTTGFINPSSTVSVGFSVLNSLGLDDITFLNPVSSPPISYIQGSEYGNYGTAFSASFNSNTTDGNMIVVAVGWMSGFDLTSISDNHGNKFVQALTRQRSPAGNYQQIWYALPITGGSETVNVTFTKNGDSRVNYASLYIYEYKGIDPATPIDGTAFAFGQGAVVDSGPFSTHFPNELIFGFIFSDDGPATGGQGFAVRNTSPGDVVEDKLAAQAGQYSVTGSFPDSTHSWAVQALSFKPSH